MLGQINAIHEGQTRMAQTTDMPKIATKNKCHTVGGSGDPVLECGNGWS